MPSFVIKDYLKVEFYIPPANTWIWGVSKWDGGNVWGDSSSAAAWTDLLCESFEIETQHGAEVDSGIFVIPTPGTATIKMQSVTYDPFRTGVIRAGTPVRIQIRGWTWIDSPTPGDTTTSDIFDGYVETVDVSYDAFGNNQIVIKCVDYLPTFLNKAITTFSSSGSQRDVVLYETIFPTYWKNSKWNTYDNTRGIVVGAKTWTNEILGTITDEIAKAGAGILFTSGDGGITYMSQGNFDSIFAGTPYWYFDSTHSTDKYHVCMSNLQIVNDSRTQPNVFRLTETGGSTVILKNQDAVDLYGENSINENLLLTGTSKLQEFVDLISLAPTSQRAKSVQFPPIKRDGNMSYFMYFCPSLNLFSPVQVTYSKNSLDIDEKYAITKVSNFIDPDTWLVTLELWQGV